MKKHTAFLFLFAAFFIYGATMTFTSCKKTNNNTVSDSAVFLFHLHTQIIDSTIGGNTDGADSNTTGLPSYNPWFLDSLGRRIELFVPQFFVSNIMLVNANGTMYPLTNVVILKGLDSEDYYLAKVPVGTYVSAMFTVGIVNSDSTMSPSMSFINDGNPYPIQSTMWTGTDYLGMKITGAYDTISGDTAFTPASAPLPFSFNIPNGLTIAQTITLPKRGTGAMSGFPVYTAIAGSTNYIHILCDYGKLLSAINLRTSYSTSVPDGTLIADSLAAKLPDMFRYEQ